MLYYFLYQLIFRQYGAASESYFYKGLNVFQYVTFRTAWAAITSLLITLVIGKRVIKKLADIKFGQEIREELSAEHQAKRGTPTMGGIFILGSVFVSTLLWARLDSVFLWLALEATTLCGLVGFADDWIKIVKKRSLGLSGKQKLAGQLVTALVVWGVLYFSTNYSWNLSGLGVVAASLQVLPDGSAILATNPRRWKAYAADPGAPAERGEVPAGEMAVDRLWLGMRTIDGVPEEELPADLADSWVAGDSPRSWRRVTVRDPTASPP